MNIVYYVFMTLTAIYVIFHIGDFGKWYWNVLTIVPVKIWNLIKQLFGK